MRSSCEIVTRPRSPSRIAWPFLCDDHPVFQIQRVGRQRVGQHLILQRLPVQPADGLEPVLLAQPIGDVGDRQTGGGERLGINLDEDLPDVPPWTVT